MVNSVVTAIDENETLNEAIVDAANGVASIVNAAGTAVLIVAAVAETSGNAQQAAPPSDPQTTKPITKTLEDKLPVGVQLSENEKTLKLQTADPPPVKEAPEIAGFDYEEMYTIFLERYGDEGMGLLAWATERGWTVEKRGYAWLSLRDDWWPDREQKVIAIGNTANFGTKYRSADNAAEQLDEGLRSIYSEYIQSIIERKEYDALLGDDYSELPLINWPWNFTESRIYRFNAAWALNSWVGSWVKNGSNAFVGETLLGDKIEGWDRVKMGALSAVEAVFLALPAAKLAKFGIGALGGEAGARLLSIKVCESLGEKVVTRLVATRGGQAFIRAYAKVYSAKWNIAVWGEKAELLNLAAGQTVKWTGGIPAKEGLELVDSVRRSLHVPTTRNIALAESVIQGQPRQLLASVSGQASPLGTVESPTARLFETLNSRGAAPTVNHTEVKILENVAKDLPKNARGTINLFTERKPCDSCQHVIDQFQARFPNIKLNLTHGGRGVR
ncbi:MAG: hypothetical protein IT427_08335 [Pirellulales bacterium]|nr:hypothetical protein [Pirellulales bacterium]